MTLITFQNGTVVMRDGKVGTGQGCCCQLCPYCSAACLEVTFSGWSGTADGCDCADLNGAWLLSRGTGCLPIVTATVVDEIGSGAVLEVTLAYDAATATYYVSSVTVVSAGTNYTPNASVNVAISAGQVFAGNTPSISVSQQREQPDGLSLIVDELALGPGSGETLTPVWQTENTTPGSETWSVASVTVTSGGSGFEEYSPVRFDIQTAAEILSVVESFDGFTVVDHAPPVVDTFTVDTASGSGATFSITWELDTATTDFLLGQYPGSDSRHWRIASVAITNGGSGYANGEHLSFTLSGRHIDYALGTPAASYLIGTVTVDGTGAITDTNFTLGEGPSLYRTDGIIQSVAIADPGEYYENSGITGATVQNPGSILATGGTFPDGGLVGCVYSRCDSIDCGGTSKCRKVEISVTDTTRTLTVYLDGVAVVTGEVAAAGSPCDNMTFSSGDFAAGDCTPGTAAVAAGTCTTGAAADSCCCDSQLYCCDCRFGRTTDPGGVPGCEGGPGECYFQDFFAEQDAIDELAQGNADATALLDHLTNNGYCNPVIRRAGYIEFLDDGVFQVWRVWYAWITAGCCGEEIASDPFFSTLTYGGEGQCVPTDPPNLVCYECTQQQCTDNGDCCVEIGPEPCAGAIIPGGSADGCKNPLP